MLKRIIGVITVKDNWAVQSIGYNQYLPMGRPEVIAANFDNWQLDEMLVVDIDRTRADLGPNFEVLEKISAQSIMTPLCYMGGVRSVDDALRLVNQGADRIALDSLFRNDPTAACSIAEAVGRQAVIRVQPVKLKGHEIHAFDYISATTSGKIDVEELKATRSSYSELMIVDVVNEGRMNAFSEAVILPFRELDIQIICFGGITTKDQVSALFSCNSVSAVAIGNSLSYREIANKRLIAKTEIDVARMTSFGAKTRGAKEW